MADNDKDIGPSTTPARSGQQRSTILWSRKQLFLFVQILLSIGSFSCSFQPAPRYSSEDLSRRSNPGYKAGEPSASNPSTPDASNSLEEVIRRSVDADRFQRFKKELQAFYQAPYVWGGASSAGTDCSGFIRTVYRRAADMDLPHSVKQLYQMGDPVRIRDLRFADLVFFSFDMGRTPDHVGMYIGGLYFMHASSSRGVTLSRLSNTPYTESYVGSKRLLD